MQIDGDSGREDHTLRWLELARYVSGVPQYIGGRVPGVPSPGKIRTPEDTSVWSLDGR